MPNKFALFDDQATGRQLYFTAPKEIISAHSPADVSAAFAKIESSLAAGLYVAGYFAYELGLALEKSLTPRLGKSGPLIHLGVFDKPSDTPPVELLYSASMPQIKLKPSWSKDDYQTRFQTLKSYIEAGDCYQVNLTFPMHGETTASAPQIYAAFRQRQPGRYGALLSLGGPEIISFSPEIFFEKRGQSIRMRPMKGTRPRRDEDDQDVAEAMRAEPKSQAENLMIVDLLRNDLSRLADVGSVKVPELFTLETYPTLHQMTSQVTAKLRPDLSWLDIFRGLYPCGSVTGAPKIRAMEIIHNLERGPRGPYCGAIGFIEPNGNASFSVAIRTAVLTDNKLRYDVGSGVVADSSGADEYEECLLKANIFKAPQEHLIETLKWSPEDGYQNKADHISRIFQTADKYEFKLSGQLFDIKIEPFGWQSTKRVKWAAFKDGNFEITQTPFESFNNPLMAALSKYAISPKVQRTDIKSSRRDFYDGERRRCQALNSKIDEVIFINENGNLTEGSFTSLFIERGSRLYTPPLAAGLLPGILRAQLIKSGRAVEALLTPDDIKTCEGLWLGNSLRGLMRANFLHGKPI